MQTVKFWTATDNSAFIYLLAHKDKPAAEASWKGFMGDFREFNDVYARYFAAGPPARSCVEVAGLPGGVDVEIEAVAAY
jgi:enamine deaminase RidA (YjgF/YER057c/UK114 family)